MPADKAGNQDHQQQRPDTRTIEIHQAKDDADRQRRRVQHMAAGQLFGGPVNLARQFAKGNDRTGEGDDTDKDAKENLDLQNGYFHCVLMGQFLGKPRQIVRIATRGQQMLHRAQLQFGVQTDENSGQANETVQGRHQLRHLGHLDPARHIDPRV